jgi:hypothetical protein
MNFTLLNKPPKDSPNYTGVPNHGAPGKIERYLRDLVRQGMTNIKAVNIDVNIIKKLEPEIVRNGYNVHIVPSGATSLDSFYLKKF